MPSVLAQIVWLLKKAGKNVRDHIVYSFENPGEVSDELWEWIKENKLMAFYIGSGLITVVVPTGVAIAGAISAAATAVAIPTLTVVGMLVAIEGRRLVRGAMEFLADREWQFAIDFVARKELEDSKRILATDIQAARSDLAKDFTLLQAAEEVASLSTTVEIDGLRTGLQESCEQLLALELEWDEYNDSAQHIGQSPITQSDETEDATYTRAAVARARRLKQQLDLAQSSTSTASGEEIRRLKADRKTAKAVLALLQLREDGGALVVPSAYEAPGNAISDLILPPAAPAHIYGYPQNTTLQMPNAGLSLETNMLDTTPSTPPASLETLVYKLMEELEVAKQQISDLAGAQRTRFPAEAQT